MLTLKDVWLLLLAFSFVMFVIYPVIILPLFNKLDPLPDGELKTALEQLCSRVPVLLIKVNFSDKISIEKGACYGRL